MTQPIFIPTPWARALGFGGLIPFVGLAFAAVLLPTSQQAWAASALVAYGAAILTFVGALHWGLTMRDASGPRSGLLVWGVVPSLAAWVAMLLPVSAGLFLVAALLWVCFVADRTIYPALGLQAWLPMRLQLTGVASLCCVVGAAQTSAMMR
jgi:hypothetical protein